ncbi:hypothetical protein AEAC466_18565 [Asticcacaulis sp. AC466]|uniref:hypothetical protein n=1 Tax=Asticcacaulis sp. AC466 TaxID=1282362 RepID=UPI0003C3B89B|nr:hypothetical protein [Asticcacaulis sp. AC466]ESQ82141.1 hypothetical protein AEAC466_18565 [Asticcacaulis sp. AC466]
MPFKTVSALTGVVCLILAGVWLILPQWILTHWQVGYDYGDGLVSRRMACLFVAFGVILLSIRKVDVREAQRAVSNGVIVACLSLIALGLYEWLSGHVGDGIWFAMALEAVICLGFLTVRAPARATRPVSVR